ncbi:hypothetical protein [Shewanella chilikensis]|uniref:hypothetical protein n=1 Tax=Shewanella chilikensis TaxID=558541 RepID=UPI003A9727BC
MNPNVKACIAYIAGSAISGKSPSSVYDYAQGKHISISGSVSATQANIYDYDRGCHIQGQLSNLYDYGVGSHIQLKISGNNFSGYDYDSGSHFSGQVSGGSISMHADGHSSYSI